MIHSAPTFGKRFKLSDEEKGLEIPRKSGKTSVNKGMKKITITVKSDADANAVCELVKTLGVAGASLQGNTITGSAAANLINPLRRVDGVESISADEEQPQTPPVNTPVFSAPEPQPMVAKIDDPFPVKWSTGVEKDNQSK
jgi:hypothetical protein